MLPALETSSPLEDTVTGQQPSEQGAEPQSPGEKPQSDEAEGVNFLQLAKAADRQAITFAQRSWFNKWSHNYQAFRGEHFDGSKYLSDDFKARSKIFVPKTRNAVTKDAASAAASLFATINAVNVTPGDESNEMEAANADVMQELINYRLDRTSGRNSIAWFMVAMGARQDSQIAGICCSKQYWDYQADEKQEDDPLSGEKRTVKKVKVDKPVIDVVAPEHVRIDPAAHWIDPVQCAAHFSVAYPMHIDQVRQMMKDPRFPWREVTPEQIKQSRVEQFEATQVRRAREGGVDRQNDLRSGHDEFDVVWVSERFIRIDGQDYQFWTLSNLAMLSDPTPTEEIYPAFGGERPYVLGYGNLEAHRIVPQSQVEVVQPLQWEINDLRNLRLDSVKQNMSPIALVKRGRKVDVDKLKRRAQNTTILVDDPANDIVFDRPPDVNNSAFAEMNNLNVDFDDTMGLFNSGTVQTNRQLNETVGGLKLLNSSANAVTEFQLRIWIETWVERVLGQLAKLEAYYESDKKVLALASKRAQLFQRFGTNEVTDEMLANEVYVRVSAGVGSADPLQKMAKMGQAIQVLTPVLAASPDFKSGAIRPNIEEFVNEVFGQAGMRDGFDRFFMQGQPMPQPGEGPPPGPSPQELALQAADKQADRKSKEGIARLQAKTKLADTVLREQASTHRDRLGHEQSHRQAIMDFVADARRQMVESSPGYQTEGQ